jgi:hypothetical protein
MAKGKNMLTMLSKVGRRDNMQLMLALDLRLIQEELRLSRLSRLHGRAIITRVEKENNRFEAILKRMGVEF